MMAVRAIDVFNMQRQAAVDREGLEKLAHQLDVERRQSSGSEIRRGRRGTAARKRRSRRGSAPRPSAADSRRSGSRRACRRAPGAGPGQARCRRPRPCGGRRCAGRPRRAR